MFWKIKMIAESLFVKISGLKNYNILFLVTHVKNIKRIIKTSLNKLPEVC